MKKIVIVLYMGCLYAVFAFSLFCANTSFRGDAKTAVIFIDKELTFQGYVPAFLRAQYELYYFYAQGYRARIVFRADETIIKEFLLDNKIHALSYFGHASFPAIAGLGAGDWQAALYNGYVEKYEHLGLASDDAERLADVQSRNFGLDIVRNNSCYSLAGTALARLFVQSGGVYYGSKGYYFPTPTYRSDTSMFLEQYNVP
ncbi:MAG: hypothetical protein COU47_03530 [Candidatus Niyogibacteria bacterium CG10_big_fil_rev_8_21_14_0_10_46_36]|uniref:Gingipain domain-containing protein n=1 Tax=Candidatus Niyogibacteria bacterium CG10_big_fil_rev_8_21_14_0_10_46_36 TaxID=1974726 RepID=A0A2H0TF23_9BACT|nr:MAG: hypothetical protein COU47_03530 [Candidatus Niyogibacteria bacterium CG10_big_fil_rev_8_21_14_0_10_46_36]